MNNKQWNSLDLKDKVDWIRTTRKWELIDLLPLVNTFFICSVFATVLMPDFLSKVIERGLLLEGINTIAVLTTVTLALIICFNVLAIVVILFKQKKLLKRVDFNE